MDTDTIALLANTDRVGDGLDLQLILRNRVFPKVFRDLGDQRWLQTGPTTLTIPASSRQVSLPDDFYRMKAIVIPTPGSSVTSLDWDRDGLKYIGEDELQKLKAELTTTASKPSAYWIAPRTGTTGQPGVGSFRAIRFNCPADQEYTAYYTYKRQAVFTDLQSNVDVDTMLPSQHQEGLILLLRAYLLEDRIGNGDSRYTLAIERYNEWLAVTTAAPEQAPRNYGVFVR